MKKIILILMALLPVLIVFFTALGAGRAVGEIKTFPVERIEIDYAKLKASPVQNIISLERGGTLNFADCIKVYPEKAKFSSLKFVSGMPEVADVENGVLKAKQYQRSDLYISIEIKTADGLKTFVTFQLSIGLPPKGHEADIIDYMGFDLSIFTSDKVYGSYCSVVDGDLIIDKKIIDDENAKDKLSILSGLVVGPFKAEDAAFETLQIEDDGGALIDNGDYTHTVAGEGTVTATVSLGGKTAMLVIIIKEKEEAAA